MTYLMDINELKRLCQEQIDLSKEIGDPVISLKQPGKWGKTNYRKLFGVKGEVVSDNFGGGIVVLYPAKELLNAMERISNIS